MPVLRPPTVKGLRSALERAGYAVADEDEFNWLMVSDESVVPIPIPKKGRHVAVGVVETIIYGKRASSRLRKEIHVQIRKEGEDLAALAEAEVDD